MYTNHTLNNNLTCPSLKSQLVLCCFISLSLSLSIFNLPLLNRRLMHPSVRYNKDQQAPRNPRLTEYITGRIYTRVHAVIAARWCPSSRPPCRHPLRSMLHPSAFREYILVISRCLFPSLAFRAVLARWGMGIAVVLNPSRSIPSSTRFVRFLSTIHGCPFLRYFLQSFKCDIFDVSE